MIKRKKTSICLDMKETSLVLEVKKLLEGVSKKTPEDIRLLYKETVLEDNKSMADCGLNKQTTKAQTPAVLGLVYRGMDGEFEELDITPVSTPPELPTQMKQQELPAAGS